MNHLFHEYPTGTLCIRSNINEPVPINRRAMLLAVMRIADPLDSGALNFDDDGFLYYTLQIKMTAAQARPELLKEILTMALARLDFALGWVVPGDLIS